MYLTTSIPQDVVAWLRDGARSALRESLVRYSRWIELETERVSPEETDAAITQIFRIAALMYALDCGDDAMPERTLDVDEHGAALCGALSEAARTATHILRETPPGELQLAVKAILPLCLFAGIVEAGCLHLAGRDRVVHIFQESLHTLWAELERRGPDAAPPTHRTSRWRRRPYDRRSRKQKCCVQTR